MTTQIEQILTILCSSVQQTLSNDFQAVFLLSSSLEARLAFDVMLSHGFDVKAYPQDDNTTKLYITHPTWPAAQLQSTLDGAKAYAVALKGIQQNLDQMCSDAEPILGALNYQMSFANSQANSKQLIVQISPMGAAVVAPPAPVSVASAPIPAVKSAPGAAKSKYKYKAQRDEFSSGPAVGRASYPGSKNSDSGAPEETLKRRIMLYIFGNMATSSYAMLIMVIILGMIFSLFVFAKAFLCPDFASMKHSNAWYCQNSNGSNEQQQQQQQQRQKQLGLPPTDAR